MCMHFCKITSEIVGLMYVQLFVMTRKTSADCTREKVAAKVDHLLLVC